MRALGAIALTLLLLGVCAATASAQPLSLTFTEARANVGVQLEDEALFGAPDTAPFEAQIDPGSGAITAGHLNVPQFFTHITEPIVAFVSVDFDIGEIEGSFDQATGALVLEGKAGGILTAQSGTNEGEECSVSTAEVLVESTAGKAAADGSPRSGVPFSHGLTGAGSIAGQWTDMEATPVNESDADNVSFCNNVEGQIDGPGGVWLEQKGDVVPPSAPQLTGTDPAAPGGLSGTPLILGNAETGSTVRIYAGPDCLGAPVATGSAAELGSPGIAVAVAQGTALFSAAATDAAGNTSACSVSISYTRLHVDPPPPPTCVVPKVIGMKVKAAKKKIRAAGCTVGKVRRPKQPKGSRLVVKSSSPTAGATKPAGAKVHLRLGPKSS